MHDLYKIYYNEVITSLIKNYELHTNTKYTRKYTIYKPRFWEMLITKFNSQKNKFKFTVLRDVD